MLVALIDLHHRLVRWAECAVGGKVEGVSVEVKRLLDKRLAVALKVVLLDPVVGRVAVADGWWCLVVAEGGESGVPAGRNVVDEHLALSLDVNFVWRKLTHVLVTRSEDWRRHRGGVVLRRCHCVEVEVQ